ncbi:MAG: TonB-dependent receptor plug domain-containing protein, partial [candidate division Zixibacteria bacterium]|nr:TonB-dependent receptor plug domain-containing protein [candidate division Zixibacteria bacterium]
ATTSKSDMTTIYNYAAPIDIRQVERIEIIRGPGSALYGSGAFLGIINVITKSLGENTITLNGGVSTIGHKDGYVSANKTFGDLSYALSASGVDSDGHELNFDFHPGAYAPYPDGIYGITAGGISDGYNTIEDTKFSARISYKDFSLQIFNSSTKIEKPVCDYWTDFNNHDNFTEFDMTLIQARY